MSKWAQILWTDETWIQPGKHKVKVTRRRGEALHRDYVESKVQRKIGWMLGGQFQGFVVKDLDYSGRSIGGVLGLRATVNILCLF
jgi:hypothetical protein